MTTMIRRPASHGFVVIGLWTSPGDGTGALAGLKFLDEKIKMQVIH